MPKKTRKLKLRADKLRLIHLAKQSAESVKSPIEPPQSALKYSLQTEAESTEKIAVTVPNKQHHVPDLHLKKDLLRITLFTVFALIVQGVLYYFLRG